MSVCVSVCMIVFHVKSGAVCQLFLSPVDKSSEEICYKKEMICFPVDVFHTFTLQKASDDCFTVFNLCCSIGVLQSKTHRHHFEV